MTELLQMRGVHAGYGETVVLEDLSLDIGLGESLALLGRNGVGKTTLLTTLMGLTQRHSGSLGLGGRDITGLTTHERSRAGLALVPQERQIFRSLTVDENLRVAAVPGPWTADKVYAMFPRLRERDGNLGHQLSGGEQQMLAIGRALVGNPRVLLLDEPFEGLAPVIVDGLVDAIRSLQTTRTMAIVLVEQHAELALELTDKALVLDRGRAVWRGRSSDLLADAAGLASLIGLEAPDAVSAV